MQQRRLRARADRDKPAAGSNKKERAVGRALFCVCVCYGSRRRQNSWASILRSGASASASLRVAVPKKAGPKFGSRRGEVNICAGVVCAEAGVSALSVRQEDNFFVITNSLRPLNPSAPRKFRWMIGKILCRLVDVNGNFFHAAENGYAKDGGQFERREARCFPILACH